MSRASASARTLLPCTAAAAKLSALHCSTTHHDAAYSTYLCVRECERHAPRAAQQHPGGHTQRAPQQLQVCHQLAWCARQECVLVRRMCWCVLAAQDGARTPPAEQHYPSSRPSLLRTHLLCCRPGSRVAWSARSRAGPPELCGRRLGQRIAWEWKGVCVCACVCVCVSERASQ
jgi:hypothetical protein